jgi:His-Xaa-Ser system radical SAM maturase HxsB
MKWNEEALLVNDVGEYVFLEQSVFRSFVMHTLKSGEPRYEDLKAKHFLMDGTSSLPLSLLATKYRTKKSFLDGFTKLHLFVVTLRCDHSCPYCQVSRVSMDRSRFDMTTETAHRAVDLVFQSPAPAIKIEFQGGEPLLNFDLIREIVNYATEKNRSAGKNIAYVIATNLSPLTDDMLSFSNQYGIALSTSLDGPAFLHNANRPRPGGNSYEITTTNLHRARAALGSDRVSALMTTTELSLGYAREIVDEYINQGFGSMFLRPISPYGFAVKGHTLAYQTSQFLSFYKTALDRIIEHNRTGRPFVETYAQLLLTKMLTPFATGYVDLQSPAGAGISVAAYNYDGDVYASDEGRMLAEMGDTTFRLGNVHLDTYRDIFGSETVQSLVDSSCNESLPGCVDCAFQPYCGADPVFHHATQHDLVGHRPTSAFCTKNMAIITHLFGLLRDGDSFTKNLLASWATRVSL